MSREYDPQRDYQHAEEIYREVGWLDKGKEEALQVALECSRALVEDLDGRPECLAMSVPGTFRHLHDELALSAITSITTGRAGRRQGLAGRITAELLAADVADGAQVAGLGMFEQGYYDRLGFGTGGYEHHVSFDPSEMSISTPSRPPKRLGLDDWKDIHRSRLSRMPVHGACSLGPPEITRAEMIWGKQCFGLGYRDDEGEITHHIWVGTAEGEHGPYTVWWTAYRDYGQLLELLSLIHQLGDQIHCIKMREPYGIQIQDVVRKPIKQMSMTRKSKYEAGISALAYGQLRICNLLDCLEKTRLSCGEIRFNLSLRDPIVGFLPGDAPWRGISGSYVVSLGRSSGAEKGRHDALPVLEASVGAFTRLWMGVRPARGLAATDELSGPPDLLKGLEEVLRLPPPTFDWDF